MKILRYVLRIVPYFILHYPWIVYDNAHRGKISNEKIYHDTQKWIHFSMKSFHVDYTIEGLEKIKTEKSFVLSPNHTSLMDPVILLDIMNQQLALISKKEVKSVPFIGKIITMNGGKYIDRNNLRNEIKVMGEVRESLKRDNLKWVIFPEGTRARAPERNLNEFKAGTFKMAMQAKVNIYPVAMWGTFRILDRSFKKKKTPISVAFLDPVTPEMYENMSTKEVAELVQKRVDEKLKSIREREAALQ